MCKRKEDKGPETGREHSALLGVKLSPRCSVYPHASSVRPLAGVREEINRSLETLHESAKCPSAPQAGCGTAVTEARVLGVRTDMRVSGTEVNRGFRNKPTRTRSAELYKVAEEAHGKQVVFSTNSAEMIRQPRGENKLQPISPTTLGR